MTSAFFLRTIFPPTSRLFCHGFPKPFALCSLLHAALDPPYAFLFAERLTPYSELQLPYKLNPSHIK